MRVASTSRVLTTPRARAPRRSTRRASPPPPRAFAESDDGGRDFAGDIALADVRRGEKIGAGSFGDVFAGTLRGRTAVVLKEGSAFRGGARFVEAEGRIWRRARGWRGGATFLGVAGANAYLVFEDEGRDTLEGALGGGGLGGVFGGGRDGAAFAEALGCATEAQACKKVSRELLKCVKGLHDKKIIHRDVKPNNVLLTKKGLRLIDLGGAADLKTGQNYDEAETVFDPVYGPPERYLTGKFGGGGGAGEWNKNKPDLFDAFSVGMVILQVSVPAFRKKNGMKGVRGELKTWAYDCEAWRASLPERRQSDFAILDENDGAGWKLVCGLVANRSQRISVSKALSSSFCR